MQSNPDRLLQSAAEAIRTGRTDVARGLWEQALRLAPSHPEALNGLGMVAFNTGQAGDAAAFFLRAARADPTVPILWLNHAKAARAMGDDAAEADSLLRVIELEPASLIAHVRIAENAERAGDGLKAGRYWNAVLAIANGMATIPADAQAAIDHAGAFVAAQTMELEGRIAHHLADARSTIAPPQRRRVEAAIDQMFGRRRIYHNQCTGLHLPFLPADEYFDRALFPWLSRLEAATDMICDELRTAPDGDQGFAPYVSLPPGTPANLWSPLDGSMDWSSLHLWRHGRRDDRVCARFPRTAALLESLPLARLPGRMPTIFFSVLAPKAHIPPHTGVTNSRAIIHLPLIVPPGCDFRVGGETRRWTKGEAWAFDDTIEHEAWNASDQPRTILIMDCWNPHLTPDEQRFLVDFYGASEELGFTNGE